MTAKKNVPTMKLGKLQNESIKHLKEIAHEEEADKIKKPNEPVIVKENKKDDSKKMTIRELFSNVSNISGNNVMNNLINKIKKK